MMKDRIVRLAGSRSALYLAVFSILVSGIAAARPQDIFDGKTLKGWVERGGGAPFRVEDGAIVGRTVRGIPSSFLCTEREFGDFLLELEFKIDRGINSGVQIRSLSRPEYRKGRVHGYQVEIDPSKRSWTGGIFDEARRGWLAPLKDNEAARKAFRQEEWNRFRILAVGNRIQTWINGVPGADLVDDKTARGFVALQVHSTRSDEPRTIRWRKIRLRSFDGDGPRPWLGGANFVGRLGKKPAAARSLMEAGDGLKAWRRSDSEDPTPGWKFEGEELVVVPGAGGIETREKFEDFRLHLEFNVHSVAGHGGENDGNSGVYLQRRYEVQILNSFGKKLMKSGCGALYRRRAAPVFACLPAGAWQSYDVVFRQARWSPSGKKTENARITVYHNGVPIHLDVEIPGKTGAGRKEAPGGGPIQLQDHGNPVRFRNFWVEPLDLSGAAQALLAPPQD